jgi:hypothetical protein
MILLNTAAKKVRITHWLYNFDVWVLTSSCFCHSNWMCFHHRPQSSFCLCKWGDDCTTLETNWNAKKTTVRIHHRLRSCCLSSHELFHNHSHRKCARHHPQSPFCLPTLGKDPTVFGTTTLPKEWGESNHQSQKCTIFGMVNNDAYDHLIAVLASFWLSYQQISIRTKLGTHEMFERLAIGKGQEWGLVSCCEDKRQCML